MSAVTVFPLSFDLDEEFGNERVVGGPIDETRLEKAARAAREAARPISDKRGSATYRRQLVHTLSRRTITAAARRAGA